MKTFMIVALLCLFGVSAMAMRVEDVNIPDSITIGGQSLMLNGAGVRITKVAFIKIKVYIAGLYLLKRESDPKTILNADLPMVIRLHMMTGKAKKKNLIDAWNEGFENATHGNTAPIRQEIEQFNAFFSKDPKKNDVYEISYLPGRGVMVTMNGKAMGEPIEGLEFKKAVFGIWLGDRFSDKYLRQLKGHLVGR